MVFFSHGRYATRMMYTTIILLFLMAWGLVVGSNAVFDSILADVNGMSPPDQQISPKWVKRKTGLVMKKHRDFFPRSKKRLVSNLLVIAAYICGATGFSLLILRSAR